MKVKEIKKMLNADLLYGEDRLEEECLAACGCDLMSDVLAFSKDNMALLTGLTNTHTLRTAEMLDVIVVVFVRGKRPSSEVVELARDLNIALLTTDYTLYEACGVLYAAGLPGKTKKMP